MYGSPQGGNVYQPSGGFQATTSPQKMMNTVPSNGDGASGLQIEGMADPQYQMINGTYAPMAQMMNGKQCWCAQGMASIYIFHTGKARWVISRRLDDGARCYAFMKDEGGKLPSDIDDQKWMVPAGGGEWKSGEIHCTAVPASNDMFVQLRMSVDEELSKLGLTEISKLRQLWKRLDFNGNNIVSLAEIDKMVVELVNGGLWPSWLNNKPALMRAYKKTILKDGDGDDWVEKKEFHALLLNIFWFNKLWLIFAGIDGDDRRMDFQEFYQGMPKLGLQLSQKEAMDEFKSIDKNGGGQVLFVEFCAYIRKRVTPDCHPYLDADIYSGTHCGRTPPPKNHHHHSHATRELNFSAMAGPAEKPTGATLRSNLGHAATHTSMVKQKSGSEFDKVEAQFKALCAEKDFTGLRKLWHRLDFNGNNIVSLAEIDKLCVESFPILNHKPALMRAYKATIKAGNGDDWVQKKEFKMLLGNLVYFNKIFWLFDEADTNETRYGDRRINFQEFKWMLSQLGMNMSEQDVKMEFHKVDKNGGGFILFTEFCIYVTGKQCPQALTAALE